MPRGFKTCRQCGAQCGPRSFECCECKAPFDVKGERKAPKIKIKRKKKPKATKVIDWQSLPLGTKFKVSSGSGPYYERNGQRTYMSEKGYFNVYSIEKDGIWGVDKDGYTNFIYMGETKPSPMVPNLIRDAHRIYVKI